MENVEHYLFRLKKKDLNTYWHSKRVAYYSCLIGKMLGYSEQQLSFLFNAALLHDIGKLYIADSILKKKDRFTNEEYEIMKKHPLYAKDILSDFDPKLCNVICAHHERLDGSGYPYQLSGYEIPYYAQILAIADSFDAMTSNRNYNQVKTFQEAIQELLNCCTQNRNFYCYDLVSTFRQALYRDQSYQRMKHYSA